MEFNVFVCNLFDGFHIYSCNISLCFDTIIRSNLRMYLTEISNIFVSDKYFCMPSGMHKRKLICCRLEAESLVNTYGCKLLNTAFYIKEISVSVHSERQHNSLIRKLFKRQCLRYINLCKLIQSDVFVLSFVIGCKACKYAV